jgi:flavin reductase (DIM6/NTAB) family NADH-FMN oxidoreductase RutF
VRVGDGGGGRPRRRAYAAGMDEPDPRSSVDADAFRVAARRLAGGVTLAMASQGVDTHAATATGFSLSLEPATVLLSLDREGQLVKLIQRAGHVGVSVLDRRHHELAVWASQRGRPMRLPPELRTVTAVTGAPLLPDALACFDCSLVDVLAFGDHRVVVGKVVATWSRTDGEPLVYVDRSYHTVSPPLQAGASPIATRLPKGDASQAATGPREDDADLGSARS